MEKGEKKKRKSKLPTEKLWVWIKETAKDPLTLVFFAALCILFATPAIFGIIAYMVTKQEKWLILSGSWIAFTAPPLPLPVYPLAAAGAIALRQVVRKSAAKKKLKKEDIEKGEKLLKAVPEVTQEDIFEAQSEKRALVDIVDIYDMSSVEMPDANLISDENYVPGMEIKAPNLFLPLSIESKVNKVKEKSFSKERSEDVLTEEKQNDFVSLREFDPSEEEQDKMINV